MLTESYYKRLNGQKVKFFPNLTRLSRRGLEFDFYDLLRIKEHFVKYLYSMRRLKSIKISIQDALSDETKWALGRIDKMGRLLGQLESSSFEINTVNENFFQELLKNKNILSHLTGLSFLEQFRPIFAEILQKCKNLKSLSLNLKNLKVKDLEIVNLLTFIQQLGGLKSLSLSWPEDGRLFWTNSKPQSSLCYLTLRFNAFDLLNEKKEGFVSHWEEINKLEVLELRILCSSSSVSEIALARFLTTKILKKISKLRRLKVILQGSLDPLGFQACCDPFFVDEVLHLSDDLERFEYYLYNSVRSDDVKVDLNMTKMEFFRNLIEAKLDGSEIIFENIDRITDLLQENEKEERDYPTLEVNMGAEMVSHWLKETLQKIQKMKRVERSLKIIMNLAFKIDRFGNVLDREDPDILKILEGLCEDIHAVKTIKGLVIDLNLQNSLYFSPVSVENVREILGKYAGIRNLNICIKYFGGSVEYIHLDGEKTQLIMKSSF